MTESALERAKRKGQELAKDPSEKLPQGRRFVGEDPTTTAAPPNIDPTVLENASRAMEEARSSVRTSNVKESEVKEEAGKELELFPDMQHVRELLRLQDRRKELEASLAPMSLADLLINDEVNQDVPISKGLVIRFRSISGEEDFFVTSQVSKNLPKNASEQYAGNLMAFYYLVAGIVSINGRDLEPHYNPNKDVVDAEAFERKVKLFRKKPHALLLEFSTQYTWFTERVRDLWSMEEIKNS